MKSFLAILFLLISLTLSAQGTNADEIRRQMAKVRQSTNWSDPAAAKKATEEIRIPLSNFVLTNGKISKAS